MVANMGSAWIGAGLVFAAVAFAVVALVIMLEWFRERRARSGLADQLRRLDQAGIPGAQGVDILRQTRGESARWLQAASQRLPQLRDLDHMIQQAALSWSVQTYVILTVGLALAFGLGGLVARGPGLIALAAAAFGAALPTQYIRRKRARRLAAFEEQLPDAVDLLGRAIRAGHPLSAGLKMVSDEMPEPSASEFRQVFEEQRFGLHFDDSLLGMADRVPLLDLRILVTAILIQREVGGNLAEVLDKIAYVIRERFTIRGQMRVITAEARMSMWVLMGLPPSVALILFVMNPAYILTLFQTPTGHMMLYASVVMQVMGFLWIRKIVDIEI